MCFRRRSILLGKKREHDKWRHVCSFQGARPCLDKGAQYMATLWCFEGMMDGETLVASRVQRPTLPGGGHDEWRRFGNFEDAEPSMATGGNTFSSDTFVISGAQSPTWSGIAALW